MTVPHVHLKLASSALSSSAPWRMFIVEEGSCAVNGNAEELLHPFPEQGRNNSSDKLTKTPTSLSPCAVGGKEGRVGEKRSFF